MCSAPACPVDHIDRVLQEARLGAAGATPPAAALNGAGAVSRGEESAAAWKEDPATRVWTLVHATASHPQVWGSRLSEQLLSPKEAPHD